MGTYVTPWNTDPWQKVGQDMTPVEFAHYKVNVQELARQSGMSMQQVLQFIEEMNDVAHTSAELDRKIGQVRQEIELSNLKARLDRFDDELKATKRANRTIELSNGNRPDMSDPQHFPSSAGGQPFTGHGGTGTGGYVSPEEPQWQAERRAQQNQDAAQGRIVGKPWESVHDYRPGGVQRFDNMSSPNHPMGPEHTPAHEFDNHRFSDGNSPAEAFVEQHGWKLHAGNGASK